MKRAAGLMLLALLAFAVSLLLTMPAAHIYAWLGERAEGVRAYGLRGTLLAGSVERLEWNGLTLDGLSWSLCPSTLVRGRIGACVKLDDRRADIEGEALIALGPSGAIHISDVQLLLPAERLMRYWTSAPIALQGWLSLELSALALHRGRIKQAEGVLELRGARLGGTKPIPLGNLRLSLSPDGDGYKGVLDDRGGPLQVDGLLTLQRDGRFRLHADLAVRDPQAPEQRRLAAALALLGPAQGGRVGVDFEGTLPLPGTADNLEPASD
jgi:hypothetical protein